MSPSPWFAVRTDALAAPRRRWLSPLSRGLLPIPLATLAAIAMLTIHGLHGPKSTSGQATYVSTESEFEQHMEFLFASSND